MAHRRLSGSWMLCHESLIPLDASPILFAAPKSYPPVPREAQAARYSHIRTSRPDGAEPLSLS